MKNKGTIENSKILDYNKKFLSDPNNTALSNAFISTNILSGCTDRERYTKLNDIFSHEVKPECYITDQMNSGRCWSFAGLNLLREEMVRKYGIEDFEFSQAYISFWDKFEKCNFFYIQMIENKNLPKDDYYMEQLMKNPVYDGGNFFMLQNIVEKYGVVPKKIYPETYSSSSTKHINLILCEMLKSNSIELKKLNKKHAYEKKDEYMGDVYKILCITMGVPPNVNEKFEWKIKKTVKCSHKLGSLPDLNEELDHKHNKSRVRKEEECCIPERKSNYVGNSIEDYNSCEINNNLDCLFMKIKMHLVTCCKQTKSEDQDLIMKIKDFGRQIEDIYYSCYPKERTQGMVQKTYVKKPILTVPIASDEDTDFSDEDITDNKQQLSVSKPQDSAVSLPSRIQESKQPDSDIGFTTKQESMEPDFSYQDRPSVPSSQSYTPSFVTPSQNYKQTEDASSSSLSDRPTSGITEISEPSSSQGTTYEPVIKFPKDSLLSYESQRREIKPVPIRRMNHVVKNTSKDFNNYISKHDNFTRVEKDNTYVFNFTPKEFYNKVVPENLNDYVVIINDQRKENSYNKLYGTTSLKNTIEGIEGVYLNLTNDEMKAYVVKSIIGNNSVWFACDMEKGYHNNLSVLDTEIFDTTSLLGKNVFKDFSKSDKIKYSAGGATHAMIINGVDLEEIKMSEKLKLCGSCSGKSICNHPLISVNKWKVANSWGTDNRGKGSIVMTDEYFDKNVYMIVVNKKVLSLKHRNIVDNGEIHKVFPINDPVATSLFQN